MKATIKQGDTFAVPIQFYDTATGEGLIITDNMIITSQINNSSGQFLASPTISKFDQITNAGMILLEVPAAVTQQWKIGSAMLDIKLQIDESIRHSQNIQFYVERSITP